jgi:hypothetical protein
MEVDAHSLSKSSWAFCEVDQGCLGPAKMHEINSIQRLKSAQQDACPNPANFTADVYQEV